MKVSPGHREAPAACHILGAGTTLRNGEVIVHEGSEGLPSEPRQGLYDPANEHDACGLGFIAHIKGQKRHTIITQALSILRNLSHRGATGADPLQGDGAGILIQLPDRFLRKVCGSQGLTLPAVGEYGVGMVFLPKEPASRMACEQEIERAVAGEGQILLGWRDVPTDNSGLSDTDFTTVTVFSAATCPTPDLIFEDGFE